MMRDDSVYLRHILEAIQTIDTYVHGLTRDQFLDNAMACDAVVRRLEIIGEAARNLSEETRLAMPDTEWPQIIGMRNRLIHAYFQVDLDLVWEIATIDLPLLRNEVAGYLEERP